MKKYNKSKGLTLIEIIISLAILAILLVPISNLVIASTKINKDGENKQKAVTIAEQMIEEIKALPDLQNGKTLTNGLILNSDTNPSNQNGFVGSVTNLPGGFDASITIKPQVNLKINTGKNNTLAYDADINIGGTKSNLNILDINSDTTDYSITIDNMKIINNDTHILIGKKYIDVDGHEQFQQFKDIVFPSSAGRKVRILLTSSTDLSNSDGTKNDFTANVLNNSTNTISLYFQANQNAKFNTYAIFNEGGVVRKYTNINENFTPSNTSRAYEVDITINKNSNKIYETKAYKTMY